MIDLLTLTNTGVAMGTSPFLKGGSAVFVNFTAGALIVQGSPDNATWSTLVTVPTIGMIEGNDLPAWIRVSTAANVYVLA